MTTFTVCRRRIYLGFLIDVSSRIGARNVAHIRRFVWEMTRRFKVSLRQTRIAIVIYSTRQQTLLRFTRSRSRVTVGRVLPSIYIRRGRRYLGRGLNYVKRYIFTGKPKCGQKRVLIVLTSGVSLDSVVRPSKALAQIGVEIFGVVTSRTAIRQIRQVTTTGQHLTVVSYRKLVTIADTLTLKICNTPRGTCVLIAFIDSHCLHSYHIAL